MKALKAPPAQNLRPRLLQIASKGQSCAGTWFKSLKGRFTETAKVAIKLFLSSFEAAQSSFEAPARKKLGIEVQGPHSIPERWSETCLHNIASILLSGHIE